MQTEDDWNGRILQLTIRILEDYPGLYRNLNEMYATLPILALPVINPYVLKHWYESLKALVVQYDAAHPKI